MLVLKGGAGELHHPAMANIGIFSSFHPRIERLIASFILVLFGFLKVIFVLCVAALQGLKDGVVHFAIVELVVLDVALGDL